MNYIHKDENAIFYECGYSCDNAIFLSIGNDKFFFTDARYTIDATLNVKGAEVIIASNLIENATKKIKKSKIKKLSFNPDEFSYKEIQYIDQHTKTELKPKINLSQKKRIIKTPQEIANLQKAVNLGAKAFDNMAKWLSKNSKTLDEKYINYKAKEILSNMGKNHLSFEPITAISSQSALPHATPSDKRLKNKDILLQV